MLLYLVVKGKINRAFYRKHSFIKMFDWISLTLKMFSVLQQGMKGNDLQWTQACMYSINVFMYMNVTLVIIKHLPHFI